MLRLHSVRIAASPGFFLLILWFAQANGWQMMATVLSAAAVHELGHWLMLRCVGGNVRGLHIGLFGAVLETDSAALSYAGELLAILAGPAANVFCALAAVGWQGEAQSVWIGANLVLCAFNLLPIRPLDGGRAVETAVSWALGPDAGDGVVRIVGTLFALVLGSLLFLLMYASGGSFWLLPAAGGLFASAWRESFGK